MTFFNRLSDLTSKKKISFTKLANAIGITTPTITGWKQLNSVPRADIAVDLAKYLDTTVEYLITGTEPFQPTNKLSYQALALAERVDKLPDDTKDLLFKLCFKLEEKQR